MATAVASSAEKLAAAEAEGTDRIAFVGRGKHFQIWEPERLSTHSAQVRARLLKLRQAQLGAAQGEPE